MTTPRPVRYRCELFGSLEFDGCEVATVRVIELSETGAFIEEPGQADDVQVGDPARLTIALPDGAAWHSAALVARLGTSRREVPHPTVQHVTVSTTGLGLEFVQTADAELERLCEYLALLDDQ